MIKHSGKVPYVPYMCTQQISDVKNWMIVPSGLPVKLLRQFKKVSQSLESLGAIRGCQQTQWLEMCPSCLCRSNLDFLYRGGVLFFWLPLLFHCYHGLLISWQFIFKWSSQSCSSGKWISDPLCWVYSEVIEQLPLYQERQEPQFTYIITCAPPQCYMSCIGC